MALSLSLLCCGTEHSAADSAADSSAELDAYLARVDPSYGWDVRREGALGQTSYTELTLTSQSWRGIPWRHQLFVFWPSTLETDARDALFLIEGGAWRPELDDPQYEPGLPGGARFVAQVAEALRSPVAVLRQVPFQPLFDELLEDDLIAYTFERFFETGDTEWPILLPMVKSAVRGMDAVQELAYREQGLELSGFTVLGSSKRGWTTWLTAAVDERVRAIAPMVIDMLNLEAHLALHIAQWGDYSPRIGPYVKRGLHQRLDTARGQELLSIVDPFRYRERLTQPKLIVIGTNDDYWPLDALNLYWDDLPEPKRVLYLPNVGHGADDFPRLLAGIMALHWHTSVGRALPQPEWAFETGEDTLRLRIDSDVAPQAVRAWSARAPDRDFREAHWSSRPCTRRTDHFVCQAEMAAAGHTALFGEIEYPFGDGTIFLSTQVRIATR